MGDTRFTLIGIIMIFAGFILLGVLSSQYTNSTVESQEFDDCYEYFEDKPPVQINCNIALLNKTAFFALVISIIALGIFSLIKGVRGNWDQKVRPEDMVGPGGKHTTDSDNDEDFKNSSSDE